MKLFVLVVLLVTVLALGSAQAGTIVYANDWDGYSYTRDGVGVGISGAYLWPEGGANRVSMTPTGRHFLGQYTANSEAYMDISGLPLHTNVEINFDLYVIGPWAGNGPPDSDLWVITADGGLVWGGTISNTTSFQTYPAMQGSSGYPAQTGATEVNTLGYSTDSVYHFSRVLSHTSNSLGLRFYTCVHNFNGKGWGIDNLRIEINPAVPTVPEPSSLTALP